MPDYRRLRVPGGTYFFTVCLRDRPSTLLVDRINLLRHCVAAVRKERPFVIQAAVVLPDTLHMIWTLPPGDDDFPRRWQAIKGSFSRHLPDHGQTLAKGERGIWQRRYWEHLIRDSDDLAAHLEFIRLAPVAGGFVADARDWPYCGVRTTGPVPSAPIAAIAANAM